MSRITFQSKFQNWMTPNYLFAYLHNLYQFDFDAAAENAEAAKLKRFISPKEDGLTAEWDKYGKRAFLNPPYQKQTMYQWISKAYTETVIHKRMELAGLLIYSRTDTQWWHDFCRHATEIIFFKGRVKFESHSEEGVIANNPAPAPSCFVVFGQGKGMPRVSHVCLKHVAKDKNFQ